MQSAVQWYKRATSGLLAQHRPIAIIDRYMLKGDGSPKNRLGSMLKVLSAPAHVTERWFALPPQRVLDSGTPLSDPGLLPSHLATHSDPSRADAAARTHLATSQDGVVSPAPRQKKALEVSVKTSPKGTGWFATLVAHVSKPTTGSGATGDAVRSATRVGDAGPAPQRFVSDKITGITTKTLSARVAVAASPVTSAGSVHAMPGGMTSNRAMARPTTSPILTAQMMSNERPHPMVRHQESYSASQAYSVIGSGEPGGTSNAPGSATSAVMSASARSPIVHHNAALHDRATVRLLPRPITAIGSRLIGAATDPSTLYSTMKAVAPSASPSVGATQVTARRSPLEITANQKALSGGEQPTRIPGSLHKSTFGAGAILGGVDVVPRRNSAPVPRAVDRSAAVRAGSAGFVAPFHTMTPISDRPQAVVSGDEQAATIVSLRGDVVIDGRKMGRMVASSQSRAASLPSASGSAVNLRAVPVFPGTSVVL